MNDLIIDKSTESIIVNGINCGFFCFWSRSIIAGFTEWEIGLSHLSEMASVLDIGRFGYLPSDSWNIKYVDSNQYVILGLDPIHLRPFDTFELAKEFSEQYRELL